MFWVMMAGILPERYSEASARWPRPGLAAAKVASIAKRRRHASSRASRLATNSSNGIGRLRVHNPPGERKTGIPHSVEIPAPVNGSTTLAACTSARSSATAVSISGAIIYGRFPSPAPPPATRLSMRYLHTMLRVRNLDHALGFYCNALGLVEVRRRVDEKGRYTLVFLAAPDDEGLVAGS